MNFESVILQLILLLLIPISYIYIFKELRHPGFLYLLVWSVDLILLNANFINYTSIEINASFYMFFASSLFIIASLVSSTITKKILQNTNEVSIFIKQDSLKMQNTFNVASIIGIIGIIVSLIYYDTNFGIENLIFNPNYVRMNDKGGTGALGLIIFLPPMSFIFIAIQYLKKQSLSYLNKFFLLICIVYMAILPERTTLINTIVWTTFSFLATIKNLNVSISFFRKAILYSSIILLVFVAFFIIVSIRTQKIVAVNNVANYINKNSIIVLPNEIIDPYLYLTANFPALSVIFDDVDDEIRFNPQRTLAPINRIFQILLKSDSDKVTNNADFTEIPFPFNTYTWLYDPLLDFGKSGSLLYVILIGLLSGLVWEYVNVHKSNLSIFMYGFFSSGILFTIMTNKFSGIFYWYAFLISTVIFLYMFFRNAIFARVNKFSKLVRS